MDEPRPNATRMTGHIGSAGRGPGVLAAIIVAFLGLAVLKPWASLGERSPERPSTVVRSTPPSPTPTPDPLAALRLHCQEPLGWRTYSRERWSGGTVRSWRSVAPIRDARGPLDRRIPVVPLGATVEAMGYCSPWRSPERPPNDARTTAWRIDPASDGGLASVGVIDLVRSGAFPSSPLGALFDPPGPAPTAGAAPPSGGPAVGIWPPGRYVVVVQGTDFERWWAVQIDPPVGT